MLNLIIGRSGSGKTDEQISMMRGTKDAIYIVPEQYSFAAEKKITAAFGVSGMGNPSVFSLRRLGYYMEERLGKSAGSAINSCGRVMVMQSIVKKISGGLTLFGGSARRGDMAKEAAVIATTFKEYNVTREKVERAIEGTKSPLLKKKLSDCRLICEEYEKFLEKGYRDADDDLEILKRNIEESDILAGREIFIDSFSAFTPLEYDVIEAMMKKCANVTVALPCDGEGVFLPEKRSLERLLKTAETAGVKIGKIIKKEGAMFTASEELKAIEESFFSENVRLEKRTESVRLYRAKTDSSEAEAAAREAERLCRDEGYRYRDIVIVARELDDYEKSLKRAFRRFDIPLFTDKKTPLSCEAAALFALSAIRIISRGWRREDVITYMKTPFAPISLSEADELENYMRMAGIRAKDHRSEEDWKIVPSLYENEKETEEYMKMINGARKRLDAPLLDLEKKIKGRKTGRELARAFYEFLEGCGLFEKTEELEKKLSDEGDRESAQRMRQVCDLLTDALESFDGAFSEEEMTAGDFCAILKAGLESIEIGAIPATTDCVCAGSIDRARGHGARAVILIGAAEGKFPMSAKDTGIFSDFDRKELEEYDIELPPGTDGKNNMEESLVYSALTCAKDNLYISYAANIRGEKYGVSPIIKRVAACLPNCVVKDECEGLPVIDEISGAKSAYEKAAAMLAKRLNGEKCPPEWFSVINYYEKEENWRGKIEEIKRFSKFENREELIKKELLAARYGGELYSSVSRLEDFSSCPFKYFAGVTLSLRERRELEVTAADSGTFLHEFVDLFGKSLKEDGLSWREIDESYIDKKTDEITLSLLSGINKNLIESSPKTRALFVKLRRIAKRSVETLSEHMKKGKFEPLGYEMVFDRNGDFKPLKIELPNGDKAVLRGRIDRCDVLETERGRFVRIIDYKSGSKTFSLPNIYYGLDLQLAAYLTAVCENGEYRPAGMLYFRIDDPVTAGEASMSDGEISAKIRGAMKMDGLVLADDEVLSAMDSEYEKGSDVIPVKKVKSGDFSANSLVATGEDFAALSRHVKKTLRALCGEILNGKSAASPVKGACQYCEMRPLCGFDTSLKGCTYRKTAKLNDKDALLKMLEGK